MASLREAAKGNRSGRPPRRNAAFIAARVPDARVVRVGPSEKDTWVGGGRIGKVDRAFYT